MSDRTSAQMASMAVATSASVRGAAADMAGNLDRAVMQRVGFDLFATTSVAVAALLPGDSEFDPATLSTALTVERMLAAAIIS